MKNFDLGKDNIRKLLVSFAIPCIIGMLINSIYNIVDQIFIGQGVGFLGNAATNVIFPLVIIFTALAQLIGNGCAAFYSLKLGENKLADAKKSVGNAITILLLVSIVFSALSYFLLPKLVYIFGCTENVFDYAMRYGRIIILGAPFMIIYTGLSAIIRADGSPKFAMVSVVIGAVLNIILDPLFIFTFDMGIEGGAIATIIGQFISCIITIVYVFKMKNIKLELKDFKLDKTIFKVLAAGLSSFITQITVLVIFIVMNNVMTKYGADSIYGADIPLSVFGVVSKLNNLYISFILGLACGAQPIIGYNFGSGKFDRVKKTIKEVLKIGFIVGIIFNLAFLLFPGQIVGIFGSADDPLYFQFATDCCRIFLMICFINVLEISSGILIQSLGNVKKATLVSITRQIVLFVPICLILSNIFGVYGALWAAPVSDIIAFMIILLIFRFEYKNIGKEKVESKALESSKKNKKSVINNKIVITINREYGSGGRYVGQLLAEQLGISFYDKDLIKLVAKETGLSADYIESNEEKKKATKLVNSIYDNDDELFIAETKVIKDLANKESCVIIGRCADAILSNNDNIYTVFIYNSLEDKIKRAVSYYYLDEKKAKAKIRKINKDREKHYNHYTDLNWKDMNRYDLCINSDLLGVEKTAELIAEIIIEKDK